MFGADSALARGRARAELAERLPLVSVVIPTHNRHASLCRTIEALRQQVTDVAWELVVVDDGSSPAIDGDMVRGLEPARIVRTEELGPAAARNAGISAARGDFVLFTDDDTEPAPGWIEAAAAFLAAHPDAVGVEGPVESPPFDPLYAFSLENDQPGAYWTCNIAFRKPTLVRLGGFYEGFPFPHCEDRDLGFRALAVGPIGFTGDMRIVHHPRSMTLSQLRRRARMSVSEIALFKRHREQFGRYGRLPAALIPLLSIPAYFRMVFAAARPGGPSRFARALALWGVHAWAVTRSSLAAGLRQPGRRSADGTAVVG